MAKRQDQGARTTLEEVNESLSSAAQRIEDNKKYINWALIAIAAIVLLAVGYIYGIRNPNLQKAKEQIGKADIALIQGNNDEALKGYEKVASEFNRCRRNRRPACGARQREKRRHGRTALHRPRPDISGSVPSRWTSPT